MMLAPEQACSADCLRTAVSCADSCGGGEGLGGVPSSQALTDLTWLRGGRLPASRHSCERKGAHVRCAAQGWRAADLSAECIAATIRPTCPAARLLSPPARSLHSRAAREEAGGGRHAWRHLPDAHFQAVLRRTREAVGRDGGCRARDGGRGARGGAGRRGWGEAAGRRRTALLPGRDTIGTEEKSVSAAVAPCTTTARPGSGR